jgi:hypothetical protein
MNKERVLAAFHLVFRSCLDTTLEALVLRQRSPCTNANEGAPP